MTGNRKTSSEIVLAILGIDSGHVYDSAKVARGVSRLKRTEFFTNVNVFPLYRKDGVHVFVVLGEAFPVSISDIGGELFDKKYGVSDMWWRARIGLSYDNFRGKLEKLRLRMSFWESRSLGMSWSKPYLLTPYTLDLGAGIADSPDRSTPWRRLSIVGSSALSRKLTDHSKAFTNLSGWFRQMTYHGSQIPGKLSIPDIPLGVSLDSTKWPARDFDTSWSAPVVTSTGDTIGDSIRWRGYRNYVPLDQRDSRKDTTFHELMLSIGGQIDYRNSVFDPGRGWYSSGQLSTNYLYPGDKLRYVQFDTDLRLYHAGFFARHVVGYWLKGTFRNDSAGVFKRLSAGGEGSVRGFARDDLGSSFNANNSIQLTAEYRFPLWTTPIIPVPQLVSSFYPDSRNFTLRLDGAVIVDHGHLWRVLRHPLESDAHTGRRYYDYGTSLGLGLRFMAPTMRRSGCIDFGYMRFFDRRVEFAPGFSLYLDMYY